MKKIINPFENNCIGCSPKNPWGLNMNFVFDESTKTVISKWNPMDNFQGYPNVLHGGIQSLMIDEIAAWSVYVLLDTAGVTKNLQVDFLAPCLISKGTITLKSKLQSTGKRAAIFEVNLYDGDENLSTQGKVEYFIYPQPIAKKKLSYPGLDAFFEK